LIIAPITLDSGLQLAEKFTCGQDYRVKRV
jgi:hypothetical protein